MRISDIVANKDKVLPEDLYDKEASGVVLILDPKWATRQVYDEAVKVLDKHGDMPAIAAPPMVWELMDLAQSARESLLSQLDTKTKLADFYANQVVELESKLADAEVKKKGEMADLGLVNKREEGGDTVDQNATKTAKGIWVPRPKTVDNSERVSEVGDLSNDEGIGAGEDTSPGLGGTNRGPDEHNR